MNIQMRNSLIVVLLAALIFACTTTNKNQTLVQGDRDVAQTGSGFLKHMNEDKRGSPAEYDPGPEYGSDWAKLFAVAPNYRSYGRAILGGTGTAGEKFRYLFGPMFYRGRLKPNQVKVFVVGQEGAQDENITNRAFTGSTGTKTQNFLNHLGVKDSYLFLNTFVYTINGQLDPENPNFVWLEQGETSPIVRYRHRLFDEMAKQNGNKLAVLLGVGSGGKASLATWINSHGGDCSPAGNMAECDLGNLKTDLDIEGEILVIGVPHPGGASAANGGAGALKNIVDGFTRAGARVNAFRKKVGSSWFPVDPGGRRGSVFKYEDAPVPYKDFAFGTNWRMGSDGTSSNRRGSDAIQVFSSEAEYNPPDFPYEPQKVGDSTKFADYILNGQYINGINGMMKFDVDDAQYDLPYEHPRTALNWDNNSDLKYDPKNFKSTKETGSKFDQYDPGPCGFTTSSCPLSKALMSWPDFKSIDPRNKLHFTHPSFGYGPSYRGRSSGAEIIVLADQDSHDDMFSARALTGSAGQALQAFLNAVAPETKEGLSYFILRTLPVDTLGKTTDEALELAQHKDVVAARNKILGIAGKNAKVLVTLGPVSRELAKDTARVLGPRVKVVSLGFPDLENGDTLNDWQNALTTVADAVNTNAEKFDGKLAAIPRGDLPFSTRWWMGTSGSRGSRGEGTNPREKGQYYKVTCPQWVKTLPAVKLSRDEDRELKSLMTSEGLE